MQHIFVPIVWRGYTLGVVYEMIDQYHGKAIMSETYNIVMLYNLNVFKLT